MALKCSMIFTLATGSSNVNSAQKRIGGWSETWYRPAGYSSGTRADFEALCRKRAALLPTAAAVTGQRYETIDPPGSSQSGARYFPGSSGLPCDAPQVSLLCRAPSATTRNFRTIEIVGLPDSLQIEGEYSRESSFTRSLNSFFRELSGWNFRALDLDADQAPAFEIDALGTYYLTETVAWGVDTYVKVLRTLQTSTGAQVGGIYRVATVVSGSKGTLAGWNYGATKGGRVRRHEYIYPPIAGSEIEVGRTNIRKVGRPTKQYVGRR